jgi:hypothetical protein
MLGAIQSPFTSAIVAGATLALCGALAPTAAAQTFQLEYGGRAYGVVPLGRAEIEVSVDSDSYEITAGLASSGLVDLFERTRLTASAFGVMQAGTPAWETYALDHHYSGKHRRVFLNRTAEGVEAVISPTYRVWGDPPATAAQQAASRDPLSSLMALGAHVGANRRCDGVFPTFDGRFHYRLSLSGGRVARFREGGYDGPALRCTLRFEPVAGYERDEGGDGGTPARGEIWFALLDDSAFAPPLRVTAPLPLGGASISLLSWRRPEVVVGQPAAAP